MGKAYLYLKKFLYQEWELLTRHYPLQLFDSASFQIYYSDHPDQRDAYAFYDFENKDCGVRLVLPETFNWTMTDEYAAELFQIEKDYDLLFFILFHEFGHVVGYNDTYNNFGLEGVLLEEEEYLDFVDSLMSRREQGIINDWEMVAMYREHPVEKFADEFASMLYQKRKPIIREYVTKIREELEKES